MNSELLIQFKVGDRKSNLLERAPKKVTSFFASNMHTRNNDVILIKEIITLSAMIINYMAFTTNLLIEFSRVNLRTVVNK